MNASVKFINDNKCVCELVKQNRTEERIFPNPMTYVEYKSILPINSHTHK